VYSESVFYQGESICLLPGSSDVQYETFILYDLEGRILQVKSGQELKQKSFHVGNITTGVYFYVLYGEEGMNRGKLLIY
jgi:hypothetical protein